MKKNVSVILSSIIAVSASAAIESAPDTTRVLDEEQGGGIGRALLLRSLAAMRAEGYEDDLIFGITAASATMGPIIPPSIPMVIYGAAASVSVGTLFMAGIGPGIVYSCKCCPD